MYIIANFYERFIKYLIKMLIYYTKIFFVLQWELLEIKLILIYFNLYGIIDLYKI